MRSVALSTEAPAFLIQARAWASRRFYTLTSHALTAVDSMPRADFYVPAAADATAARLSRAPVWLLRAPRRYRHVVEHLIRNGSTVLVGDLRGHGESGGESGATWSALTTTLTMSMRCWPWGWRRMPRSARDRLRPRFGAPPYPHPAFVTHSMGGLVGFGYVLARPERHFD